VKRDVSKCKYRTKVNKDEQKGNECYAQQLTIRASVKASKVKRRLKAYQKLNKRKRLNQEKERHSQGGKGLVGLVLSE